MDLHVHYSREGTPGWSITSWETANQLLTYLDPDRASFACFTLPDGSYVQCAGSKRRLTVEARLYEANRQFKHYRFGKGQLLGREERIDCNIGPIHVDRTQILQLRDARTIIKLFIEERRLHPNYVIVELNDKFENPKTNKPLN
jgi:hypothetical protein